MFLSPLLSLSTRGSGGEGGGVKGMVDTRQNKCISVSETFPERNETLIEFVRPTSSQWRSDLFFVHLHKLFRIEREVFIPL